MDIVAKVHHTKTLSYLPQRLHMLISMCLLKYESNIEMHVASVFAPADYCNSSFHRFELNVADINACKSYIDVDYQELFLCEEFMHQHQLPCKNPFLGIHYYLDEYEVNEVHFTDDVVQNLKNGEVYDLYYASLIRRPCLEPCFVDDNICTKLFYEFQLKSGIEREYNYIVNMPREN